MNASVYLNAPKDDDSEVAELPIGTVINERFIITGWLGKGGFGFVYAVEDQKSKNERLAIKEFFPEAYAYRRGHDVKTNQGNSRAAFKAGKSAFEKEASLLRKIENRNVVRVFDWFEANGTCYMVMKLLEGKTLKKIIEEGQLIDKIQLREWLGSLLDALDKLHANEIWHRDISPGNIFICADSIPVLIDFGAARQSVGKQSHTLQSIANEGFSAVELYSEDDVASLSPAPDIYSLGATFYNLITGVRPPGALRRFKSDRMTPLADLAKGKYDARFLKSIDRALAPSAPDRWLSARRWLDALAEKKVEPSTRKWWIIGGIVVLFGSCTMKFGGGSDLQDKETAPVPAPPPPPAFEPASALQSEPDQKSIPAAIELPPLPLTFDLSEVPPPPSLLAPTEK